MNKDNKYKAIIYQYYKTNIPLNEGHIELFLYKSDTLSNIKYLQAHDIHELFFNGKNTYKYVLNKLINKLGYNIVEIEFKTMHLDAV
jgi:hypothetical protein